MSAIFGIFNLNGQLSDPGDLNRMSAAISAWGADNLSVGSMGAVGFGCAIRYNTPESVFETLPLNDPAAQLLLTANARLDNRADLFRQLNVEATGQCNIPDSALIIRAYQKWGTQCPKYLLGKWAFAIWDNRQCLLFIARDQLCGASLYYYQGKQRFIFSSSLKGILVLPDVPCQLNEVALAQLSVGNKRDAATFYKDIYQLTPGQSLSITAEKTTREYYWHPREIADVRFASDEDYIESFLEIYQQAVSCRLRSYYPVASTLSSGLDSGSITALAARELAQNGQQLHSISWRPGHDFKKTVNTASRTGDENSFIQEMAAYAGNIDTHFAYAKDSDPLIGIRESLDILEQPNYIIPTYYWFIAILRAAQKQNRGTLLAGTWGNFTVSWGGDRKEYLAMLLKNGEWGKLRDVIYSLAKKNPSSVMPILKNHLLQTLYTSMFPKQQAPHRLMVRPEAAQAVHSEHLMIDPALDELRKQAPQPLSAIYNMFQSGNTAVASELGDAFNVDVRTPPTDKRIVEFCLGIPPDQYISGSQNKLLIRRSMAGLIPESILNNKKRGMLGGDHQHLIRVNQGEFKQILKQFDSSELIKHWLDVPQMKQTFDKLQHTMSPDIQLEIGIFMRGITIGLFLLRFD